MPRLTKPVKTYIVQQLAMYSSPSEVAALVKESFGVEIDRGHVRSYNPEQVSDVAARWRAIFDSTRKAFLAEVSMCGIAHRAVRMKKLDAMISRAEQKKNDPLAASLLEQAAKEMGGMYTNRREFSGANGRPLALEVFIGDPDEQQPADEPPMTFERAHEQMEGLLDPRKRDAIEEAKRLSHLKTDRREHAKPN